MSYLSENLKVLIWKNKGELPYKTYREYMEHVADQCQMEPEHLRAVLRGDEDAASAEASRLSEFFQDYGYDLSAIQYMPLFDGLVAKSGEELLGKNLQFLLRSLNRGKTAEFVAAIGVNPSTVSRWKRGSTKPDPDSQMRICKYFGYPDARVLKSGFLFLGLEPASSEQRKRRCREMIESMDQESFERIYPALVKLLR